MILPHVYRWEDWCLRLKTSTLKPCHIICQLGSALDYVDGVKVGLLEPTLILAKVKWEGGITNVADTYTGGLQLTLSKTIGIGDTQCIFQCNCSKTLYLYHSQRSVQTLYNIPVQIHSGASTWLAMKIFGLCKYCTAKALVAYKDRYVCISLIKGI